MVPFTESKIQISFIYDRCKMVKNAAGNDWPEETRGESVRRAFYCGLYYITFPTAVFLVWLVTPDKAVFGIWIPACTGNEGILYTLIKLITGFKVASYVLTLAPTLNPPPIPPTPSPLCTGITLPPAYNCKPHASHQKSEVRERKFSNRTRVLRGTVDEKVESWLLHQAWK